MGFVPVVSSRVHSRRLFTLSRLTSEPFDRVARGNITHQSAYWNKGSKCSDIKLNERETKHIQSAHEREREMERIHTKVTQISVPRLEINAPIYDKN